MGITGATRGTICPSNHPGPTKAVKGSKAVGEPPLMLAISVREGIKDAVAAFGGEGPVELAVPSTGEAVFLAIRKRIAA